MKLLRDAKVAELESCMADAIENNRSVEYFEELAQAVCSTYFARYRDSIVLARCYVTTPFSALPERNAAWVQNLAEAKGVAADLREQTPVISLVGTAGRAPAWNSRFDSRGHVGIPMVSASFIDAIPMMSRLMASLGGSLSWIESNDISHIVARLGSISGVFYVPEASTELDARGRKIIPAADFVAEYGVRTVFGVGGAFNSGQIFVLLMFCSEHVPLEVARDFQSPLLHFKTSAARFLRKVFVDGGTSDVIQQETGASVGRARRSLLPDDPVQRAERLLELLDAREREVEILNRLYLKLESELEERARSLRTILNSTSDGLLLADLDGSIHGETTAMVERWFGPRAPGAKIRSYLFGSNGTESQRFELGFSQIAEECLPLDVAVSQMPTRFERGKRTYSLEYHPVYQRERLSRLLVVVRDITDALEAAHAERRARELQAVLSSVLRDRREFVRFVEETQALLERLETVADAIGQARDLHTLKGTTAVYGFQTFAELVHRIEGELVERQGPLAQEQQKLLRDAWKRELATVAEMAAVELVSSIEITTREYDEFLARLRATVSDAPLIDIVRRWRYAPVTVILNGLGAQARRIAERLGKTVEVRVDGGGLRVPLERTRSVWTQLVHAVRNAVDHGLETREQRQTSGKAETGLLTLSCSANANGDGWSLRISDDGAGIDWNTVRRKAVALGLPHDTETQLIEALFTDGFTTREELSEISGRGVGLSALRAACRDVGAKIELSSRPGHGTSVCVVFPPEVLEASA